ncbi:hypothetical protein Pcinc_016291 [Petrolisthes cinctipes]|uniref:Uncharacterized protein n=1 Tax=Petrolisthes cinctipes TaxID=88211 RepID=A0AAE1FRE6_PETCI|nr:hypothetical protein Pcinc_016291 [Petrolisthes cinctipes]
MNHSKADLLLEPRGLPGLTSFFCDPSAQVLDEVYFWRFLSSTALAAAPGLTEQSSRCVAAKVLVHVASQRSIIPPLKE